MKRVLYGMTALGLFLGAGRPAKADLLSYSFSGTASGALGMNTFSDASFTITSTGDTSLLTHPAAGVVAVPDTTATVFVSGLGTATFLIPTDNRDNQNFGSVGFSAPVQSLAILFESNPAFATYNLTTPIGPIAGASIFNPGAEFATTAGNFSLTSVSTVTFQATLQSVPEPSAFLLVVISMVGISGWALRRKG